MKIIGLFLCVEMLYSCNGTSRQKEEVKAIGENLRIKNKTTLSNTYTKSGLLDISYKTDSMFFKGKFAIAISSTIKRDYDNRNNLLTEKTFEDGQANELLEEKIFSYDGKNNLISEIDKSNGITISITKMSYNEHNQEIKRIEMRNKQADDPTLDLKDQSNPLFDTLVIANFYDQQGNLIKQTNSNSSNVVQFNLFTFYTNGQKTIGYEVDENSDTMTIFKYKKVGDLIEETVVPKPEPNTYITTWYDGKKKVKSVFYDSNINKKIIEIYKYDENGNEIEKITYE